MESSPPTNPLPESEIFAIERPLPRLMTYYLLSSFILGPLFFILLIPRFFRYETLRYRFDDDGISMRWGILFRREVNLTYSRIQDIHLRSNVIERWLGIARIEVQTASGSAESEMTLEGLPHFEGLRDYLYGRMRGVGTTPDTKASRPRPTSSAHDAELGVVLREVAAELRALRASLGEPGGPR